MLHQYTTDLALFFEQSYVILYHLPTEFVCQNEQWLFPVRE